MVVGQHFKNVRGSMQEMAPCQGLPCGPVVKNPACTAGDTGPVPGQGTEIPSPRSNQVQAAQLESSCAARKTPWAVTKALSSQIHLF